MRTSAGRCVSVGGTDKENKRRKYKRKCEKGKQDEQYKRTPWEDFLLLFKFFDTSKAFNALPREAI